MFAFVVSRTVSGAAQAPLPRALNVDCGRPVTPLGFLDPNVPGPNSGLGSKVQTPPPLIALSGADVQSPTPPPHRIFQEFGPRSKLCISVASLNDARVDMFKSAERMCPKSAHGGCGWGRRIHPIENVMVSKGAPVLTMHAWERSQGQSGCVPKLHLGGGAGAGASRPPEM